MALPNMMADVVGRLGHFGWIPPAKRSQTQHDAHARATARHVAFALAPPEVSKGTKVMLTDWWKHPDVIADVGYEFTGFRQLTGSCVGVSSGNAVFTLAAGQKLMADNPTKAFVPWWPFSYGRTRYNEGDRGRGEGAVDSVMAATLRDEGCFGIAEIPDEPAYDAGDGLAITDNQELTYSDGSYAGNTKYLSLGKQHPIGAAATINDVAGIKAAILNGYPVLDGCDDYIGHGSVSGDAALGNYDGRGGHSTCYLGYWEHDSLGPLYLYSNQWAGNTYPQDGSGRGRCTVWVKEANVNHLFQNGGSGGETVALSRLSYFPAEPKVLNSFSQV